MQLDCVHESMDMPRAGPSPTFGAAEPWPEDLMHYMCHGFINHAATQVDTRASSHPDECGGCFSFSAEDREQRKQKKQLPCTACRAATDRSEHPASGDAFEGPSHGMLVWLL
mmetsp:Transcript_9665/g.13570  ORF Transcript_9665/g.13570 Transcript_9665/m.13570 type:complete len:112 (+) Transcript_9665:106-441(+)